MLGRWRQATLDGAVWAIRLLATIAMFLMPANYSAGAEAPHPHPFYQVWIDARSASFTHHHPGSEEPVNHHLHQHLQRPGEMPPTEFTPAHPDEPHHKPHQHEVGIQPSAPEIQSGAPRAGSFFTPELRQISGLPVLFTTDSLARMRGHPPSRADSIPPPVSIEIDTPPPR